MTICNGTMCPRMNFDKVPDSVMNIYESIFITMLVFLCGTDDLSMFLKNLSLGSFIYSGRTSLFFWRTENLFLVLPFSRAECLD